MTDTTMIDITRQVLAAVHHSHDEDRGNTDCLQIELGNKRAITLTVSEREPPSVGLWHGNGEWSFVATDYQRGETLESFREFVAAAFEPYARASIAATEPRGPPSSISSCFRSKRTSPATAWPSRCYS